MIKAENLSYGFPAKELYNKISFEIEEGDHAVLVGANGCGKSTLLDIIMQPKEYLYDGKLEVDENCRIGYASQLATEEKDSDKTVFQFLSQRFTDVEKAIEEVCQEMSQAGQAGQEGQDGQMDPDDMEKAMAKYQELMDLKDSMDGDNYESNILKSLHSAGLDELKDYKVSDISGGEFKVLQIMGEMLLKPNVLLLDEPDAFLDFENIDSLCRLLNNYEGTLLVVTHSRYLLNHCFNRILHLEGGQLQDFSGNYSEYRCWILREKLRLKLESQDQEEEIKRTQEMVEILRDRATDMVNPVIGKAVHAKQSQLDRLKARAIKEPFIEIREPQITLPEVEPKEQVVLEAKDFKLMAGEKVAMVGANGAGKTTIIRDVLKEDHPDIKIGEGVTYRCMSQLQGEAMDLHKTVYELLEDEGFVNEKSAKEYLAKFCLDDIDIYQRAGALSGGEQNLLQVALIARSGADLLILDEPTSHLDVYAQAALEKAIREYRGTVLMVSHDFYLITGAADYVLMAEDGQLRQMRSRKFRKMVYDKYFSPEYFEEDRKKQEIEMNIIQAYKKGDLARVEKLLQKCKI